MAKISFQPRVPEVSETYFSKKYASNPDARARHDAILKKLQDAVKDEVEEIERSERLTAEDYAVVINARAEDLEESR